MSRQGLDEEETPPGLSRGTDRRHGANGSPLEWLRDSKHLQGPQLAFAPQQWAAFVSYAVAH
ncbi:DUF397 domain-containing protein [Streptomyces fodineus]|uniref:DUF397 domain-containing protein n=1 Tax=Streptomyces fodineus TaxID=1904616 RepID=UPI0009A10E5A|nr:DUF397 domain-containing protein [Streptomyces fodineus]